MMDNSSGTEHAKQATASGLQVALYRLNSRFELGEMHDAAEAHEALLDALHRALAVVRSLGTTLPEGEASHGTWESHSCVKRIFSMKMQITSDPADPTEEPSQPVVFEQWTQYVFASELRAAVRESGAGGDGTRMEARPLLRVLRKEAGLDSVDGRPRRATAMLRVPHVFTLGLASETARASKAEIGETLDGVEESLNLRDVYGGIAQDVCYNLLALTAFYEQHYTCFCRTGAEWLHYDDDVCKVVGRDFADVRRKCVSGRLHPVLLFYELVLGMTCETHGGW